MQAVGFVAVAALVIAARPARADNGIPAVTVVEAPGVTCPSAGGIEAALARVRGGPAPAVEPAFRLFIDGTADQAHIDLQDGRGRDVLVRDIPMTAGDCDHAAEAIALIVERHFRALDWPAGGTGVNARAASTLPASAPVAPPATTAAGPTTAPPSFVAPVAPVGTPAAMPIAPVPMQSPAPRANPPTPPAAAPPPPAKAEPETPRPDPPNVAATAAAQASAPERPLLRFDPALLPRFTLGAGPAFWSRGQTFAVALAGRWRVLAGSPFEVGAGVLLPPLHASTAVGAGGSVHVGAVPITGSVGWTAALGRAAAGAHAGVLWTVERGQSESIPAPATAWRSVVAVGLGLWAALPITARLRLTAAADGYRAALGRSYAVSGVPGTVLDPSPWQAVVVLGAEWVVSP